MTKQKVEQIRKDMNAALKEVSEKHGVSFDIGSIRYDSSSFRTTVKAYLVKDGDATDSDDARRAKFEATAKRYGHRYGVKPEDYGKKITHGGQNFILRGIKPRATKRPIVAEKISNGKMYILQTKTVTFVQKGI